MLSQTAQTNEPTRCSVLLPLLVQFTSAPRALRGRASAGLCLMPDRYGCDYAVTSRASKAPLSFTAPLAALALYQRPSHRLSGAADLTLTRSTYPRTSRSNGWSCPSGHVRKSVLKTRTRRSVWPAPDPPRVIKGDLLTDVDPLIATAPKGCDARCFHTAVLAYVTPRQRSYSTIYTSWSQVVRLLTFVSTPSKCVSGRRVSR